MILPVPAPILVGRAHYTKDKIRKESANALTQIVLRLSETKAGSII